MSPRIIHMPLSGGDRKAQAKARREARGIAQVFWEKQVQARAEAEELYRRADQYFCDAWTSLVFWGEPTRNSPTIAQAINGGRPLLWAKCRKCAKEPVIDLRSVKRRLDTHVHLLESVLFCEECSRGKKFRQRADILGLKSDEPPADPRRNAIA